MASSSDRLSLLPDEILIDILSRLPIRNAITTGILSHRWQYLWTHITSLNIIDTTVPDSLHVLDVLPRLIAIHKLTFHYKSINEGDYFRTLFRKISSWNIRQVKVLSIDLYHAPSTHNAFIDLIFRLPSLIALELHYTWPLVHLSFLDLLTLPDHMNLKVLKLRFDYDDCCLLISDKLIKSCPLLEDLSLTLKDNSTHISFKDEPISKPVIVDAPNLKYLKVDSFHLSRVFFANNSVTMVQCVDLSGEFGTLDDDDRSGRNIFDVMSKARCLILGSPILIKGSSRMTMLGSLVQLKCTVRCSVKDITHLLVLLSKCPILEVLILNFTDSITGSKNKQPEFFQRDIAPASLVTLKRVVMNTRLSFLDRGAFFMVKYFLRNASVLERLIVNVTGRKNGFTVDLQCHELQVCKDIFALSRKSTLCQVEYFGASLRSSDFERKLY